MNFKILIIWLSFFILLASCTRTVKERGVEITPQKIALVIGNANYTNNRLKNPVNDAEDIAKALVRIGFKVIKITNASLAEMKEKIEYFGELLENGNVGVFYFAGHGMQYQGKNYLFPIGTMHAETKLKDLLDIQDVLDTMEKFNQNEDDVNIVFLDACRDNPFRNNMLVANRSIEDHKIGLAMMNISSSLIAYSTKPNAVASDGKGRNSPYVKFLKKKLVEKGLQIEDMLKQVRVAVLEETHGEQAPGYYSELNNSFCFAGKCSEESSGGIIDEVIDGIIDIISPSEEIIPDDGKGPEMVWIPSENSKNRFAIGRYEVSFAEYDSFVAATGRRKPSDEGWGRGNNPVINVSWYDATAYAEWLSKKTGEIYRLPTEAEWEYAAQAGTTTNYWWGDNIGKNRAVCDGCGSKWDNKQPAPIDSFAANPFGLHNTVGNVWEWTCSEYKKTYTKKECNRNNSDASRAIRGGSWFSIPATVRSAFRYHRKPSEYYSEIGFRLVKLNNNSK